MSSPRISVILPTYNRRARLERVLAGLDRQSEAHEHFEVVVVDDGSTDDTSEWLARQPARGYALSRVRQPNGGPARARNTGIAAARGELLLFLDDDVEPTPDLVLEHVRSHALEQDVVVMGPLASLEHYAQPWVSWEQRKVEAQYAAMLRGDWQPTFRQFWTGNASVAKRHVLAAGGFDTNFLRAEDIELGRRLHELGLGFRFNPNARGLHHAERSLAAWEKMHASYGALEVEIFGGLGEEELVRVLSDNFSQIHPATHFLVSHCAEHPLRAAAVERVLHGWLTLAASSRRELATAQVCGALANLIYWRASVRALGPRRTALVFDSAARQRRARNESRRAAARAEKGA